MGQLTQNPSDHQRAAVFSATRYSFEAQGSLLVKKLEAKNPATGGELTGDDDGAVLATRLVDRPADVVAEHSAAYRRGPLKKCGCGVKAVHW